MSPVGLPPDLLSAMPARVTPARVRSPDGKRIAYTVVGGGLFVKDTDATGGERELAKYAVPLSWSRDGRILAFQEGRLFLMPLDGSPPVPVGASVAFPLGADISPDGKYVAFASGESGRLEMYVEGIAPERGKWQISANGGVQPRWRRDGKELFFLSPDSKMMAVDLQTGSAVTSGIPRILFETSGSASNRPRSYDVTADGLRFLIASGASGTENASITVVLNWWASLKDY